MTEPLTTFTSRDAIPRGWIETTQDSLAAMAMEHGDYARIDSALNVGLYTLAGITYWAPLAEVSA